MTKRELKYKVVQRRIKHSMCLSPDNYKVNCEGVRVKPKRIKISSNGKITIQMPKVNPTKLFITLKAPFQNNFITQYKAKIG